MVGVTPSKTAFDTAVTVIGLPILVGDHANDLVALHLSLETASDAAIGAGRDDRMLRLAEFENRLLDQGRCRTSLDAGAARNAFGIEKRLVRAGRDVGGETAPVDGQREGTLHLFAGAHAARAHDAF